MPRGTTRATRSSSGPAARRSTERGDSKDDFDNLKGAPDDPGRGVGSTGVSTAAVGAGKLDRPLVVGINTWAGHAPGIVYNGGMEPSAGSLYKKKYGLDVKFVLLEDPAAKLAAFRSGHVDIMWDTVDNWAREASILAEQNQKAKSIIMQDWSRGGDGIVSLASIKSVEDLKGHKIACTQFTPSHFLLLYLLSQSGLTPEDRNAVEKNIVFTTDAPAAAAAFKAKQVDAAVTWEPDLSGAVEARGDEAHVLVSTQAATNIIADTLVARQDLIDKAPETVRDFVHGWLDGIEMIKNDPNSSYDDRRAGAQARQRHSLRHALGLEAHALRRQRAVLRPDRRARRTTRRSSTRPSSSGARRAWSRGRWTRKDWADARFLQALAVELPGAEGGRSPGRCASAPSEKDIPILGKQIQIQFTPGSDEIMPGSYFAPRQAGRDDDLVRQHLSCASRATPTPPARPQAT